MASALATGVSILRGPLESEDTLLLRGALERAGARLEKDDASWLVHGCAGNVGLGPGADDPAPDRATHEIHMGNNGTGIRFMASVLALNDNGQRFVLKGTRRMEERPIEPLLAALRVWGASVSCIKGTGCPPVFIEGRGLAGGRTLISASQSSQFLSSLLLVGPYTRKPAVIGLDGPLVSRPYVDITISVMESFGVSVKTDEGSFAVEHTPYSASDYMIEGDGSSASYFLGAAAITGGRVTVDNLPADSMQGDARFCDILEQMGCAVEKGPWGTAVTGPPGGRLHGIRIDMGKWPDMVPTLAVVAAFAEGETVLENVAHLRIKETDRLSAMASELGKMGCRVAERPDGLVIRGGAPLHGAVIETYDDHRIAMALAIAGLKVRGVMISNPGCVQKSFPDFWDRWEAMLP